MNSVAEILKPGFARSWHECVAIVQEAASLMQPGLALPAPEDLLFSEDGRLILGFGSEASNDPVGGLASLLLDLLEGVEAPGGLREIAVENSSSSPAHSSIEGFSRALAFYERPNRSNDLKALAVRLHATREQSSADLEFARLREKVAQADEPKKPEQKRQEKPKARFTRRQRQVIAVGVTAGLVAGFVTLQVRNGATFGVDAVWAGLDEGMTEVVAAGLNSMGFSIQEGEAPAADTPVEKPAPARDKRAPARGAASPAGRSTPVASRPPAASRDVRTSVADSGLAEAPATRTTSTPMTRSVPMVASLPDPAPVPAAFEPSARIYSPQDDAVSPPQIVRPQMPREPKPGEDTGWFDLVVDESGRVERVKLISPFRRYQERMLMAAAKAWRFRPATLDGEPVKYQVRVPIILPGMP